MTKLYTVTIEYEYVIAVEDDEEPYDVAEDAFGEVRYEIDRSTVDMNVFEMSSLPSGWDLDCYPYRCDATEKTIGAILEENKNV